MPLTYVNAINALQYFNAQTRTKPKKLLLLDLAAKMIKNDKWLAAQSQSGPRPGPGGGGNVHAGGTTRSGASRPVTGFSQVSINGGPPSRESPCKHVLIPLS